MRHYGDVPPPVIHNDNEFLQANDPRYNDLLADDLPKTESFKLVIERLSSYWESDIKSDILSGKTVLIGLHGDSLCALVKTLDKISDANFANLNFPTGTPLVYEFDDDLK